MVGGPFASALLQNKLSVGVFMGVLLTWKGQDLLADKAGAL